MRKTELFGIQFDALKMDEAVQTLRSWIQDAQGQTRYVVTPNVDHAVQYQSNDELRQAYENASLVVVDGRPVLMASKLLGKRLPECVPGSDLVPALFDTATPAEPLRVFLLGAAPGVADRAAKVMANRWPHVIVVGTYSPPLGFETDPRENEAIAQRVNASQADALVIGLGAPKQELWINRMREEITTPVSLCVGATIDFLAGNKSRAPKWMQRLSLEWCHRMLSEPRRLVPRYAKDAWVFPQLCFRQAIESLRGPVTSRAR